MTKQDTELTIPRYAPLRNAILSFDGESQYVEIPDNKNIDFDGLEEFTISFWFLARIMHFLTNLVKLDRLVSRKISIVIQIGRETNATWHCEDIKYPSVTYMHILHGTAGISLTINRVLTL